MDETIQKLLEARAKILVWLYREDFPGVNVVESVKILTDILVQMGWKFDNRVGTMENGYIITLEEDENYRMYDPAEEEELFFGSKEEMDYYIANNEYLLDEE